jgi:hypothetical protein
MGERGGPLRALLLDFYQDALDPVVPFDAFVVEELQFGRTSEAEASGELTAKEGRRALQRPCGLPTGFLIAQRRVEDMCVLEIGADLDAGHGQEADARVVHLPAQHPRNLYADLIADALRT